MLKNREIYSSELPHIAVAVFIYLSDRCHRDGKCFPSITIAADLKISKSSVKRALSDLEKAQYIRRERRFRQPGGNSSNMYFVARPPLFAREVDYG